MWLTIGQWVTLGILIGWAGRTIKSMMVGDRRTVHLLQLVHFIFCGLPLFLDLFIGPPPYTYHVGYIAARSDDRTTWLYLGYILVVPVVFKVCGGRASRGAPSVDAYFDMVLGQRARQIAGATAIGFVLAVLLTSPQSYVRYGSAIDTTFTAKPGYLIVSGLSGLAALSCVLLLCERSIHWSLRSAVLPLLFVAVWIQGKRSIVAMTLFAFFYASWKLGHLRGRAVLVAGSLAVVAVGGFSAFYQNEIRSTNTGQRVEKLASSPDYVYFRVDYGRDAGIRQAIHSELNAEARSVLDYRGQSLVFLAGAPIPRSVWPSKPFAYSVYSTSRALGIETQEIGWGITTSWLEEAIANFSWLGFLLGPAIPALMCNIGDRRKTAASSLLTVIVVSLMLTVHIGAFLPILALWFASLAERPRRLPSGSWQFDVRNGTPT